MAKIVDYICPLCRAPRKLALKNSLGLKTHIRIFLICVAIAALLYMLVGLPAALKSFVLYFAFWAVADLVKGAQIRSQIRCPNCHFDSLLYRRDWRQARKLSESRLQGHLEEAKKSRQAQLEALKARRVQKGQSETTEPNNSNSAKPILPPQEV